jgi:hypothetical protein
MKHLTECAHAFIKNNVVQNIFVFDESAHGTDLLDRIKIEQGCDTVVCLCDHGSIPHRYSTWDGTNFIIPTLDFLYSIGVSSENQMMVDARIAEEAAKAAETK